MPLSFGIATNFTYYTSVFLSWRTGGVKKMEYLTVFRVVLGCAVRSCTIATVSSSVGDHATPGGTKENDAKYREILHFIDTPSCAKKEKPKYNITFSAVNTRVLLSFYAREVPCHEHAQLQILKQSDPSRLMWKESDSTMRGARWTPVPGLWRYLWTSFESSSCEGWNSFSLRENRRVFWGENEPSWTRYIWNIFSLLIISWYKWLNSKYDAKFELIWLPMCQHSPRNQYFYCL